MCNKLILDTHVFLWSIKDSSKLDNKNKNIIEKFSNIGCLAISQISVWETFMLAKSERIVIKSPSLKWLEEIISKYGISVISINNEILYEAVFLLDDFHKDPADRIIVATTRCLNATLMTRDQNILKWAERGHIKYIEA